MSVKIKQTRSPLYPIFLFVIINLIIFTLSRLGLAIWQADRVSAVAGWGQLFLQGLRM
ncbi:MAG: LTA synthase family protein, partial [Haemophilus parainfluenzae]|nr:LTA synthase family protein [Haemophilus parainfluenzae]